MTDFGISWNEFKAILTIKDYPSFSIIEGDYYRLWLNQAGVTLRCDLHLVEDSISVAEFEASYKSLTNQNIPLTKTVPTLANFNNAIYRSISNKGTCTGGTISKIEIEIPDNCVLFGGSYEAYGVVKDGDYIDCGLYFCPAGYPGVEILQGNKFMISEYIMAEENITVYRNRDIVLESAGLAITIPPSEYGILKLIAEYYSNGTATTNDVNLIIRFNLWRIP